MLCRWASVVKKKLLPPQQLKPLIQRQRVVYSKTTILSVKWSVRKSACLFADVSQCRLVGLSTARSVGLFAYYLIGYSLCRRQVQLVKKYTCQKHVVFTKVRPSFV